MTARYVVVDLEDGQELDEYTSDDPGDALRLFEEANDDSAESYFEGLDDEEALTVSPPLLDLGLLDRDTGWMATTQVGVGHLVWHYLDAFSGKWRPVLEVAS